jgi:hypothetical protein
MPNKRVSGLDYFYNSELYGVPARFASNPSVQREMLIQRNIERNISELAVNRFKWEGLPDSIDPRFLEVTMLLNGLVIFYWDDDYDKLLAVKASATGYVNFMDWPVAYTIIGPGSRTNDIAGQTTFLPKELSGFIPFVEAPEKEARKQGFPVWPNYFRQSELDTVRLYSSRLAATDLTLEINTRNARQNKVVVSTTNTQLSMVNLARQMDEGVNVIQPKDAAMMDNITAVDLGINPDLFDKLSIMRTRWWNECMGLLGIDNANQDKKERLVEAEVGANDAQTDSLRFVALQARQQGIEHVNKTFGLNITVDYNTEIEAQAEAMAAQQGIDTKADSSDSDSEDED